MGKHSAPLVDSPIDLLVIDQAQTLAACKDSGDILAWSAKQHGTEHAELCASHPYAAGFGAATILITELLAIIEWQAAARA
jgi:hypothetical protein